MSVGGGGLIGGVLSHYQDDLRIIAVETELTASMAPSREKGEQVTIMPGGISASGLGASAIGDRGWAAAQKWLEVAVVSTPTPSKRSDDLGRQPTCRAAHYRCGLGAYVPARICCRPSVWSQR